MSSTDEAARQGEDGNECPICNEIDLDAEVLPCGHKLCIACFKHLGKSAQSDGIMSCPLCRNHFSVSSFGNLSSADTCDPSLAACSFGTEKGSPKDMLTKSGNNYCLVHLDEDIVVYCRDCREPGCLTCIIERHQRHEILKINTASEMLKQNLRDHSTQINDKLSTYGAIANEIELKHRSAQIYFETLKDQVSDAAESVHKTITGHAENLHLSLSLLKQEKFTEYDDAKSLTEQRILQLQAFLNKSTTITQNGTMYDVVHEFEALNAMAVRLSTLPLVIIPKDVECLFEPTSFERYLSHKRQNLVGDIYATKEDFSRCCQNPVISSADKPVAKTGARSVTQANEISSYQRCLIMVVIAWFISLQGVRMFYGNELHSELAALSDSHKKSLAALHNDYGRKVERLKEDHEDDKRITERQARNNMTRFATTPVEVADIDLADGVVTAMTSLHNLIFVAQSKELTQNGVKYRTHIVVYDTLTYGPIQSIIHPMEIVDMTSSSLCDCMYLLNREERKIIKISLSTPDRSLLKAEWSEWSVPDDPISLSVSLKGNVIVTFGDVEKVREYTSSGDLIREISLPSDVRNPRQAVQLDIDKFVVVHQYETHRTGLSIVDNSNLLHSQTVISQADIAVNGFIFVTDSLSQRVVMLSSTLTPIRDIRIDGRSPRKVLVSDDGHIGVLASGWTDLKLLLYHFK